jgi:hypothetical protein
LFGRKERLMRGIMVRYRVKPERVAQNEELVLAVYEELRSAQPEGFRYATFRLPDGVSFVHLAFEEEGVHPLRGLAAFRRLTDDIEERCDEPPAVTELLEIGSYRLD